MQNVIHIFGASGSGTSTLGRYISDRLGYFFMDTDDYFWLPTDPPFTKKRDCADRLMLMQEDLASHENAVISGSLTDWGDSLISLFTLAVRLVADTELRLDRIKIREKARFGSRIEEGGDMHRNHLEFLAWAGAYDLGPATMRSRAEHNDWQKKLSCKLLTLNGGDSVERNYEAVLSCIADAPHSLTASKSLSEMTIDELWHLFPIQLCAPNPKWEVYYSEMEQRLSRILADYCPKIHHIGSTAIRGIYAKPIIDVLVELETSENLYNSADLLSKDGFRTMSRENKRISMNLGYTERGFDEKVYHIHLRLRGDKDEVYFRDYLNIHHDVAKNYEVLKLSLWKQFEFNRDGYTEAKTKFIRKHTEDAKKREAMIQNN